MSRESRIAHRESGTKARAAQTFEVPCTCGRKLLARREHVGKRVACSGCAKMWRLEKARDPQTLQTTLRVAPIAPKKKPPPPSPLSGKGQDLLCVCGHSLRVQREHLGKRAQCPACGTLMRLERDRDPQTHHTVVRAKVVGKAEPPPEKADWSLDDFA